MPMGSKTKNLFDSSRLPAVEMTRYTIWKKQKLPRAWSSYSWHKTWRASFKTSAKSVRTELF